ncbi:VOC family protein [Szabonella alba]|uniref:VOC family protein n=1 Tax=Szabonella alba TaxID=2804194 RepID=A0A8K0XZH7_9RHOB|nr:VOC family protein [Szabonella alba]MBL4916068.1 VOC family protein [Szabonella alba]
MRITPYLHFEGGCEAAMSFYAATFGAALPEFFRFCDIPGGSPEMAASRKICHVSLTLPGGGELFASDFPPGVAGDAQKAVSVHLSLPTVAEAQALFVGLSEGGDGIMPFAPTFWSQGFGMVRDRFGTHWMVSGPEVG